MAPEQTCVGTRARALARSLVWRACAQRSLSWNQRLRRKEQATATQPARLPQVRAQRTGTVFLFHSTRQEPATETQARAAERSPQAQRCECPAFALLCLYLP